MQPNTWKYFPFPKIAFPENIYFSENILHEPNTALVSRVVWKDYFEDTRKKLKKPLKIM